MTLLKNPHSKWAAHHTASEYWKLLRQQMTFFEIVKVYSISGHLHTKNTLEFGTVRPYHLFLVNKRGPTALWTAAPRLLCIPSRPAPERPFTLKKRRPIHRVLFLSCPKRCTVRHTTRYRLNGFNPIGPFFLLHLTSVILIGKPHPATGLHQGTIKLGDLKGNFHTLPFCLK